MEINTMETVKDNGKKILIILIGVILLTAFSSICFYKHQASIMQQEAIEKQKAVENAAIEAQVKEKAISNASQNGYDIQFVDEKTFCFEKDNIKYSFDVTSSGICFDECEFAVEEKDVKVKEGDILIRIRNNENDTVDVGYHDTRVVINDDGTEEGMFSGSYFISNTNFDKNSLVIQPQIIDDKQKSIDAYDTIMKFTTADELKEQYNKALAICKQLNE